MGKRGPTGMPTEKLKLAGYEGKRANPKDEPQPNKGAPLKPATLGTGYASDLWDSLVYELENINVIATIDGGALERYCLLKVEWLRALGVVKKEGQGYSKVDALGNNVSVRRHEMQTIIALNRELLTLEAHYGLTPTSRSRLTVDQMIHNNGEAPSLNDFRIGG